MTEAGRQIRRLLRLSGQKITIAWTGLTAMEMGNYIQCNLKAEPTDLPKDQNVEMKEKNLMPVVTPIRKYLTTIKARNMFSLFRSNSSVVCSS